MTAKITTLSGENVFETLKLQNQKFPYEITSKDLAKVRTSFSELEILQAQENENQSKGNLKLSKMWLGIFAAAIVLISSLKDEK